MITITINLPGSPTVIADMGQIIHTALIANATIQVENDSNHLVPTGGVGDLTPVVDDRKISKDHKITK